MTWIALLGWILFGIMVAEYRYKTKKCRQQIRDFQNDAMHYYGQMRTLQAKLYGDDYVFGSNASKYRQENRK